MSKIRLKKLLYGPISFILALIIVLEPMSVIAAPDDKGGAEQSGVVAETGVTAETGETVPASNPEKPSQSGEENVKVNVPVEGASAEPDSDDLQTEGEENEFPTEKGGENQPDRSGNVSWSEAEISKIVRFYFVDPDPGVDDDEYIVLGAEPTPVLDANQNPVMENGQPVMEYQTGWIDSSYNFSNFLIPNAIRISERSEHERYRGKTVPVREIGPHCFENATGLLGVTIPEGITSIGDNAFYASGVGSTQYEELQGTINIPASVERIGKSAFGACSDLHEVTATPSETKLEIDEFAFSNGMEAVSRLDFSEGVVIDRPLEIADNAFYNSQVESLDIPQVETIGDNAFYGSDLSSFVIPKTLTEIGDHAFSNNSRNLSVSYEETEETDLPDLTIGSYAFANEGNVDNNVVSLELDSKRAVTLGDHAFYNNKNMHTLAIAGIVSAPQSAFENCGETAAVQSKTAWPTNLSVIEKSAFKNCKLLESVDLTNVTSVGNNAFTSSSVSSLTLPETSENFGTYVFSECADLTSVTVPENWEIIPEGTFKESDLESLTVLGITEIGEYAFDNCISLQTASIENVVKIDRKAFYNCLALISVDARNAVEIDQNAFEYDISLEHIELPAATTVAENAFAHCTALQYAYLPLLPNIAKECFKDDTSLKTVYMPQVITVYDNAFENCTSLLNTENPTSEGYDPDAALFELSDTTTLIRSYAFTGCSALQNAEMDAVTEIQEGAFSNCTGLTDVSMVNVLTLGTSAFADCTLLANVDMPAIQTIGDSAFTGCTHLSNVDMTAVQTIGKNAFFNTGTEATEITTLSFPALTALTSIDEAAFQNSHLIGNVDLTGSQLVLLGNDAFKASSISGLTLPTTQPTVFGTGVFSNCASLTDLTIPRVDGGYNIPAFTFYNTGIDNETSYNVSIGLLCNIGESAFTAEDTEEVHNINYLLSNCNPAIGGVVGENAFANSHVGNITFNSATLQPYSFANATVGALTFNGSMAGVGAFSGASAQDVTLIGATLSSCSFASAQIGDLTMNGSQILPGAFASAVIDDDILITGTGTHIYDGAFAPGVLVETVNDTTRSFSFHYLEEDVNGIPADPGNIRTNFSTPTTFRDLTISGSNTTIDGYAFLAAEFESLHIPATATGVSLGNFAFSKIEQAANDDTAEELEELIVVESDTLETVSIEATDIAIGDYVFNNRVAIAYLTLPETEPEGLGQYIFANCRGLTATSQSDHLIPTAWTYLPDGFFYGCTGITYLYLPENLNTVGAYVFTTKGTPQNHTTVWFESAGRIRISDSAFHGVVGEEPQEYSWLDIYLLQKPKYSVAGFAGGWGAWQTEDVQYWIHWKLGVEDDDPGCFFAIPRVILGGNNYDTVTDSHFSTFIEIAVKLGNSSIVSPETTRYFFDEEGALKDGIIPVERQDGSVDYYTITQYTIKDTEDIVEFDYLYYLYYDLIGAYTPSYIEPGEVFDYKYAPAFDAHLVLNADGSYGFSDYGDYIYVDEETGRYEFDFKKYINDEKHSSLAVNTIGESAFAASGAGFVHIYVPDTVTSIENNAFRGQRFLENLTNLNGSAQNALMLTKIGDYAFQNCTALTSFAVHEDCPKFNVGNYAFQACINLTEIDWPQVDTIGNYAFNLCNQLDSVTIDWVDRIGDYAFDSCTHLTTVDFGHVGTDNDFTGTNDPYRSTIGQYAFQNCYSAANGTGLTHFHIGSIGAANAWANIDTGAFSGCIKLNDFRIDSGYIDSINSYAFNGVSPNSPGTFNFGIKNDDQECVVYNVGGKSFYEAYQLNTLYFDRVVNISDLAFSGSLNYTDSTIEIDNMGIPEGGAAPTGTAEAPIYGTLDVNAFKYAKAYHIQINNGKIGTIANSAFNTLSNVQTIELCDVDTFGTGDKVVNGCSNLTTLTFGNVNKVGNSACYNVPSIQTLTFDSVTTIGGSAFYNCNGLINVSIDGAVSIGKNAFLQAGASSANAMDFPATVKTIGEAAFKSCNLLGEVRFPHGADTSVGANAFTSSTVSSIVFDADPPATMGTYIFQYCQNLTSVVFPNENSNWTKIPDSMFYKCTNLEAVDLGTVTEVGQFAFEGCGKLTYVDFRGVEKLKMGAFGLCEGTKSTQTPEYFGMDPDTVNKLPSTVTEIGVYAFHRNNFIVSADLSHITEANKLGRIAFWKSSLSSVTLPANSDVFDMSDVDQGMKGGFFAETKLSDITIPATWQNIYDYSFAGCDQLAEVTIEGNDNAGPKICNGAFSGCTALTDLTIEGNSEIDSGAFVAKTGVNFKRYSATDTPSSTYAAAFAPNAVVTMNFVKKVNDIAFKGCVNLAEVKMQRVESIGEQAFYGCTSLSKINYNEHMQLQEHNNFRKTNAWYTQANGWNDTTSGSPSQYDPNAEPAYLYEGHDFAMSCIPKTTLSIGAKAFCGCPIKNLYIADVCVPYSEYTPGEEVQYVGNGFNENAFSGIGCAMTDGRISFDDDGNPQLVSLSEDDRQNYVYIFVQHNLKKITNSPWASNAIIEWDDGVIGSPEYGLYYSYSSGKIVSVYDQREIIETPIELPDALGNMHNITGFKDMCFVGSNVKKLFLNENTVPGNIDPGAFRMPGTEIESVPQIFIPHYENEAWRNAINDAIRDPETSQLPENVRVEFIEDPFAHFPTYISVDGIPDEQVIFTVTFDDENGAAITFDAQGLINGVPMLNANYIYEQVEHTLSLGMDIEDYLRGTYDEDGTQLDPYIEEDTTNFDRVFTYKLTESENNTDQFTCSVPEVWCDVSFIRENDKTEDSFSMNYTPEFRFYTVDENGDVLSELGSTFTFENKGAKPIFLVYNNEAPDGYTMTFADGMFEGEGQRVPMVKKYEVIIQGGVPTCVSGDSNLVFAGWEVRKPGNTNVVFDRPYATFKGAGVSVESLYGDCIITNTVGEEFINLYPIWKDGSGKTVNTTFRQSITAGVLDNISDELLEEAEAVAANPEQLAVPKRYGYTFDGYGAPEDSVPLLQYQNNRYELNTRLLNVYNHERYVFKRNNNDYRWWDCHYGEEGYAPAQLVAMWSEMNTPTYNLTLQLPATTIVIQIKYNDASCYIVSQETGNAIEKELSNFTDGYSYYTAASGGVQVIDSDGNLIPGIKGWTTEEINGTVRWIASGNRTLYAHAE